MLSKQMSELTVSESSAIDDCIRKSAVTNESMKKFKAADAGWEPTTTAERELSKELKYVSTGHLYPVRHDRAVAPTEVEFKFLNEKNGGHNLAAVIKGHSEQTIVVYEKDENKEETKSICALESSQFVHSHVDIQGFEGLKDDEPVKYFQSKVISLNTTDEASLRDSNMKELVNFDVKDNRLARGDRLTRFAQIYGNELVNVSKSIDVGPILLASDVIVHSFVCRKVSGLTGGVWNDSRTEISGLVTVSLIKNTALNRLRMHFSFGEQEIKFAASEKYSKSIFSTVTVKGLDKDVKTTYSGAIDVKYSQTSNFKGGDWFVPIDHNQNYMSNCYAYRKTKKELTVTGAGNKSSISEQVQSFINGQFVCCGCADKVRYRYFCCTTRCIREVCTCCKNALEESEAEYSAKSEVKFNATDVFILGGATKWSETAHHPQPLNQSSMAPDNDPWLPFCLCFEYKGRFKWACCKFIPKSEDAIKTQEAPATWSVSKAEEDDIFLEFTYRSIEKGHKHKDHKLVMLLDSTDKDPNDVYNSARKMVSIVGVQHGELFDEYEKAELKIVEKQAEDDRKEAEKKAEELKKKEKADRELADKEAEAKEKKAIDKALAATYRENEKNFIKEATESAIREKVIERLKKADEEAAKRLELELRAANAKGDYLTYVNFLKERATKGEPKWDAPSSNQGTVNMTLDLSSIKK